MQLNLNTLSSSSSQSNQELNIEEKSSTPPKKADEKKTSTAKKKTGRKKVSSQFEGNTYGILVVDDEPSWKNLYELNLFKNVSRDKFRFEFYTANNGLEALKTLVEYYDRIQIVILDLKMNKRSGMEFLKNIVDQIGMEHLGIFIVTAYGNQEDMNEALIRGVRGFIDKSQLDFDKFSNLICRYLELKHKKKAIDLGIYLESRFTKGQRYLYIRWHHGDAKWSTMYIGNITEINNVTLPNLITKVETVEGLIPIKKSKAEKS